MKIKLVLISSVMLVSGAVSALSDDIFIAGVNPDVRPQYAPVITKVVKDGNWYATALTGVVKPYPYSLHFLENQGNWFTPFIRPGMTGPYDIRGWHSKK